jgi:Na+(H+)/acetate symporter ActP
MNLLTIGDFYKQRYGKGVEVLTSVAIVASYLGWTSAQMTALGLVIYVLSGAAMDLNTAILLGAAVVLVYTIFGGMWSVAFTDLFQTVVILIGLSLVALLVGDLAGGASRVIAQAAADGKFVFRRVLRVRLRLDPAAGRLPAHDQREEREDRGARHDHRRADLLRLRLRADLHRLCGGRGRSGDRQAVRR